MGREHHAGQRGAHGGEIQLLVQQRELPAQCIAPEPLQPLLRRIAAAHRERRQPVGRDRLRGGGSRRFASVVARRMASGVPRSTGLPSRTGTCSTTPLTSVRTGASAAARNAASVPLTRRGQRIRVAAASRRTAAPTARLHAASRQLQQRALAGRQRAESVHHRDLMVELGVPEGDSGLVGENRSQLSLGVPGKVSRLGFEEHHPQNALLVPQREIEGALDLISLQIGSEEGDEQSLRVGGGRLPLGSEERLPPAGGPLRTGHEVAQLGILGVHLLLPGHRSDLAFALVVHRDRAAIEGEGTAARLTTVWRTRSRSRVAVISRLISGSSARSRAASRSMELGVAQGERGGRGQTLEQLPVTLVETPSPVDLPETRMAPTLTPPPPSR